LLQVRSNAVQAGGPCAAVNNLAEECAFSHFHTNRDTPAAPPPARSVPAPRQPRHRS
jgi:hypothetical protein